MLLYSKTNPSVYSTLSVKVRTYRNHPGWLVPSWAASVLHYRVKPALSSKSRLRFTLWLFKHSIFPSGCCQCSGCNRACKFGNGCTPSQGCNDCCMCCFHV